MCMVGEAIVNRTPLYTPQRQAGASFVQLFGWPVATSFGDEAAEYRAAREGAVLLDRSYVGRFRVTGNDALDLLNRLSSNKVDVLPAGTGAGTVLPTNKGRVIDLLHLFAMEDHLLMLTSPQTRERVAEWIDTYTFLEEVALEDVTEETAMLTVMGPGALEVLEPVTGKSLAHLETYGSISITVGGVPATVLRTDPTDVPGYDLVVPAGQAEAAWSVLTDPATGAIPAGEATFNVLRVEAGLPRYGWELNEGVNPWEANLRQFIHFEKGCYVGQEVILRLNTYNKVQRQLTALAFSSAQVTEGAGLRQGDKDAGNVTSVVEHPISGEPIGLGLVRAAFSGPGNELDVVSDQGEQLARASVQELPARAAVTMG